MEQDTGVEPAFTAWEAVVLPIYESCVGGIIADRKGKSNRFLSKQSIVPLPDQGTDLTKQQKHQKTKHDYERGFIGGVVEKINDSIYQNRNHQNDQQNSLCLFIQEKHLISFLLYQFLLLVSSCLKTRLAGLSDQKSYRKATGSLASV